jgi:hypothetical protein
MRANHSIPVVGVVLAFVYFSFSAQTAAITVDHLQCEYKTDPVGLDVLQTEFF